MSAIQQFHDAVISLQPIDLLAFASEIPEFQLMRYCTQSPSSHAEGDVLIHANMAAKEVLLLLDQVEKHEDKVCLYLATILHDIGKKAVWAVSEKTGRITAYGHDKAGVPLAREFLFKYFPEMKFPQRSLIVSLIANHMLPRMMMSDGTSDKKLKLMSLSTNTKLLTLLSIADTKGRIADNMFGCELLAKFKDECDRLNIFGKPYVIPDSGWMSNQGYSIARWNILMHNEEESLETMNKAEDLVMNAVPRFQVLMLSGAPGSGKSTKRNELATAFPQAKILSMDERRKELTGSYNDQSRNPEVFDWEMSELHKAMRAKQSVIIDATNCTKKNRKALWDAVRRAGGSVGAIQWDLPLKTLLERNAAREKVVPDAVVEKFFKAQEFITGYECDNIQTIDHLTP